MNDACRGALRTPSTPCRVSGFEWSPTPVDRRGFLFCDNLAVAFIGETAGHRDLECV